NYSNGLPLFPATSRVVWQFRPAKVEYVKKDKEKDELKLLCQDLMDVYNMEQISIKKWEAKTI
ncbi:hypothetical protein, partial [Brevibacillus agri]|uniref:hypothetical protein n=1 Tax=Brevibacillus agri TaxID=51101 RepID=UPI0028682604